MTDFFAHIVGANLLRALGVLGFVIYVLLYASIALRLLSSDNILYFVGCVLAASLVLLSLTQDFNLASALIQCFWIVMGIPAILLRLAKARSDRAADLAHPDHLAKDADIPDWLEDRPQLYDNLWEDSPSIEKRFARHKAQADPARKVA